MNRLQLAAYVLIHGCAPSRRIELRVPATVPDAPPPLPATPPLEPPPFEPPLPEAPPLDPPVETAEATTRLIALRDKVQQAAEHLDDGAARTMTRIAVQLAEILALDRVEAFEDGGPFDPDRQRPVDTLDTQDPEQDDQVAATVRPGYRRADVVLRHQDVILYRLDGRR